MPPRKVVYVVLAVIVLVIGITLALQSYYEHKQPTFNASKLIPAMQAFARDRVAQGQALPATVSLSDLVAGGYFSFDDVSVFRGADVTFYLGVDLKSPKSILARARMPDGSELVMLADGSLQELAREPQKFR
jgi:hypothetical protein